MTTGGPNKPEITQTERTQLRDKAFAHLDQFITDKTERGTTRLSVMGEILKAYPAATEWNAALQKKAEDYLLQKLKDIRLEGNETLHKEFIKAFLKNKKIIDKTNDLINIRKREPKSGELRDVSPRSQQENEPEVPVDHAKTEEAKRKIVAENAAKIKAAADKQTAQQKTTEDLAKTQGQEAVKMPTEQTPIKEGYFHALNPEKSTPKTHQAQMESLLGSEQDIPNMFEPTSPKNPASEAIVDQGAQKRANAADAERAAKEEAEREAKKPHNIEDKAIKANKASREINTKYKKKVEINLESARTNKQHPFNKEIKEIDVFISNLEQNKKSTASSGKRFLGLQFTSDEKSQLALAKKIREILVNSNPTDHPQRKLAESMQILNSHIEGAIGANKEFRAGPGITDNLSSILDRIKEKAEKIEPKESKKSKSFLDKVKDVFSTKPTPKNK